MQNKANLKKSQVDVTPIVIMNYENKSDWTLGENKPNSNPIKPNLRNAQMNVNSLTTKDYRKKDDFAVQKNKPNSKPNKANLHFTAENTEYAEKKDISVSDCSIEKYALYPISPCSLRTRRLMKNKAKTNPIKANFLKPKMNLKLLATKGYENKTALGLEQNKPKQSQCFFLPILPMPRKLTQEPPFSKKPGNGSPRKNQPSNRSCQPKKCRNF